MYDGAAAYNLTRAGLAAAPGGSYTMMHTLSSDDVLRIKSNPLLARAAAPSHLNNNRVP